MHFRLRPAILAGAILFAVPSSSQTLFQPDSSARRSREFHALHYKLELSFDHRAKRVSGSVSIRLTPISGPLDSVLLDAVDMQIRAVTLSGGRARSNFTKGARGSPSGLTGHMRSERRWP
jgi:aminopeptidase N